MATDPDDDSAADADAETTPDDGSDADAPVGADAEGDPAIATGFDRPRGPIDYAPLADADGCNYLAYDRTLARQLRRSYGDDWADAGSVVREFAGVVGTTIAANAEVIDRHGPTLHTYDRHGEVVNEVEYHPAQHENERLTYPRGVVADVFHPPRTPPAEADDAIPVPERDEPLGIRHGLAMQAVLSYADAGFTCPVSMTTGAALVLDRHADGELDPFLDRLTSRDPDRLAEGAMFLTETQGGSDVGATETVAERAPDATVHEGVTADAYRLTGEKWFCSNLDAGAKLVLARRPDAPDGTDGLSLFLVPHERPDGSPNDLRCRRLKDKLGTISVPTGEVELHGALGYLVGEPERGFRQMTTMLNWERLTNAVGAVGVIGRALLESKVRAATREAFGATIDEYPLMRRDLVGMAVDHEAATAFALAAADALHDWEASGRDDGTAFRLMRLLTPVAKLATARLSVETASDAMEIQGGNGYVREFVTHRLLRDAQVLPIWEGTSNVLSLDLLRALDRERAHEAYVPWVADLLDGVTHPLLSDPRATVADELDSLQAAMASLATVDPDAAQHEAKVLAWYVYDVTAATLLLADAQRSLDGESDGADGSAEAVGDGAEPDAREALVARWFVETRFETPRREARGIVDGSRLPLEWFDAVVRYARVDPAEVTVEDGRLVATE
jgi:acyl-CoA dehydrogenase